LNDEPSELLYNCEPRDILESEFSDDCDINVDMSGSKQGENSNDEGSASDNSDMQHDTWTRVDAERLCFPFSGKPSINVDLEDEITHWNISGYLLDHSFHYQQNLC
jgi:hypothetical protein